MELYLEVGGEARKLWQQSSSSDGIGRGREEELGFRLLCASKSIGMAPEEELWL